MSSSYRSHRHLQELDCLTGKAGEMKWDAPHKATFTTQRKRGENLFRKNKPSIENDIRKVSTRMWGIHLTLPLQGDIHRPLTSNHICVRLCRRIWRYRKMNVNTDVYWSIQGRKSTNNQGRSWRMKIGLQKRINGPRSPGNRISEWPHTF